MGIGSLRRSWNVHRNAEEVKEPKPQETDAQPKPKKTTKKVE